MSEQDITLVQGSAFPILYTFTDGCIAPIASSFSGTLPTLNVTSPHCFDVGEIVQVLHSVDGCEGLSGAAIVREASASSISVEMADGSTLSKNGGVDGFVAKAANLAGYFLIGGIFSHLPSDPSPLGLQGSADQGSDQILVQGFCEEALRVGDLITFPAAGIRAAKILNLRRGTAIQNQRQYTVIQVSAIALHSVPPNQPRSLSRQGAILAQFRALPIGDGSTGQFRSEFKASDILAMSSGGYVESCEPSCDSIRQVGCYQILLGRGVLGKTGYKPFYSNDLQVVVSGKVFLQPSIAASFQVS